MKNQCNTNICSYKKELSFKRNINNKLLVSIRAVLGSCLRMKVILFLNQKENIENKHE